MLVHRFVYFAMRFTVSFMSLRPHSTFIDSHRLRNYSLICGGKLVSVSATCMPFQHQESLKPTGEYITMVVHESVVLFSYDLWPLHSSPHCRPFFVFPSLLLGVRPAEYGKRSNVRRTITTWFRGTSPPTDPRGMYNKSLRPLG